MIDLRQMRYFVALGETLHFGRAAARLNVTQPPLSRQVADLEATLGVQLVLRKPRAIALTPAGKAFFDECRSILARVESACDMARRIDQGELGEISVGFMIHAAQTVGAALARRFMAAFPAVALRLNDIVPRALLGEVMAGRIDAGILFAMKPMQGLSMKTIFSEMLCCAMPAGHDLAGMPVIPATGLRGLPIIAARADLSQPLRDTILQYCRSAGFEPDIHMEVQLQQTILSLVAEGLGIAIVPESLATFQPPNVVFRPLENAPRVENVLIWRTDNGNPALPALIALADCL